MTDQDRWVADHGDVTHKVTFPLGPDSVVLDVGGYYGDWSMEICAHYNPYIHIFEPLPEFYEWIKKRFSWNPKVSVYNFGLSDRSFQAQLTHRHSATSLYLPGDDPCTAEIKDVAEIWNFPAVDLMSINVEGEEYKIISRLLSTGIIHKVKDLQVQFHCIGDSQNWNLLRKEIRNRLQNTHSENYCYEFVWESWRKQ
jgi:FkbM family methyltransferase